RLLHLRAHHRAARRCRARGAGAQPRGRRRGFPAVGGRGQGPVPRLPRGPQGPRAAARTLIASRWRGPAPAAAILSGSSKSSGDNPLIDRTVDSPAAAVADIHDGATVLISGFGGAGVPNELIDALIAQGARDLTVVNN